MSIVAKDTLALAPCNACGQRIVAGELYAVVDKPNNQLEPKTMAYVHVKKCPERWYGLCT